MGLLDRERERDTEMYHLTLFLLISPAFGMPSNVKADVGAEIINQLDSFVSFNIETGNILDNSNLTEKVVESLQAAEKDILEMEVELKTLQYEVAELRIEGNYFPEFNKAKSHVRETRQGLRKLAHRTVAEVRDLKVLLEDLDKSDDSFILKISVDEMKGLMIETQESLEDAREKYHSAMTSFKGLNSIIRAQNTKLTEMLTQDSAEHQDWVTKVTDLAWEACANETDQGFWREALAAVEDILTNDRNCSASIAAEIAVSEEELRHLKTITDRMLESGTNFDKTLKEAIDVLTIKINQISLMTKSVEVVSENIDKYPQEFLRKYQAIRTVLQNGLDDLKNGAEQFLAQPVDINWE